MWLCWTVFLCLINISLATSPIVLPICCGLLPDDEDPVFKISYVECNITVGKPSDIFKNEWKGHTVNWNYSSTAIMCLSHYYVNESDFEIHENGSLLVPCKGKSCCGNTNPPSVYTVDWELNMAFCMDYFDGTIVARICKEDNQENQNDAITVTKSLDTSLGQKICLVISAFLLVVTCGICLTEKSVKKESYVPYLVSQSISLAAAFICLARIQFFPEISHCWECLFAGYCLQYFFLAAFFWMNAKCINVYMSMSRLRLHKSDNRMLAKLRWQEFKRFSLYAWGVPFLITITTYSLQISNTIEDSGMKPDIGTRTCFFESVMVKWIYFYGPMAVIIVVNIILFALTAAILVKHRRNFSKVVKRRKDKSRLQKEIWFFNQYLKLFMVTGLNWLGEVLAAATKDCEVIKAYFNDDENSWLQTFWKTADIFNCLHGAFIFYFFVCQKNVLVKRLVCIPKNYKWTTCSPSEGILCCCWVENQTSVSQPHPKVTTQTENSTTSANETSYQNGETSNGQCVTSKRRISTIFYNSAESVVFESVELNDNS